ncbi:MAG: mannonate oxidoreductase [Saprospiraceae bacterium]|nr:MAG: mannonate oxidoreductase [Saprospiraceae bacterium]
MLFSIGTKVKFLHSSDEGVVTGLLSEEMVNVLLKGEDMEIPVFVEDLIRIEDEQPTVKAKIVPGPKPKTITPPESPPAEIQYTILKSVGLQLAFEPIPHKDGTVEKYKIFLINDTKYHLLVTFVLYLQGQQKIRFNGKLNGVALLPVGELAFDQLNDGPEVSIESWRLTTEGTGSKLEKKLKIKAKQFFRRKVTAPLLNKPVHLFRIFEDLKTSDFRNPKSEDLQSYTKRNVRPSAKPPESIYNLFDVQEFAEFIPEIDLHIEKLVANSTKINKGEILRIQMAHFDNYLQQAIRLGVERVFIIHGVGEGKLRDAIATRLLNNPEVVSFKNEYHHRYGYGATEVLF